MATKLTCSSVPLFRRSRVFGDAVNRITSKHTRHSFLPSQTKPAGTLPATNQAGTFPHRSEVEEAGPAHHQATISQKRRSCCFVGPSPHHGPSRPVPAVGGQTNEAVRRSEVGERTRDEEKDEEEEEEGGGIYLYLLSMRKGYKLSRLSLTPACLPPRAEGRVGGSDSTTPPQARPGVDQTTLKGPPSPRSGSGGLSLVDGANPPHFLTVPTPTARPRSLLLASFARLPAPRYTRKRSLSSLHTDNTARLADGYCRLYSFWVGGCFTVMLPLSTCTNGRRVSLQPA